MHRSPDAHRREFDELGYTVFENLLSDDEVAAGSALFDELLTPDTQPPIVTGDANELNGRKQLNSKHCEPRLAMFGTHPRLLEAASVLIGPDFRLTSAPIPCATFKSRPGGERFDFGYHVDWPQNPPRPGDLTRVNSVLHFAPVEPGGGAFMVVPRSHRLILSILEDPELRERALQQKFEGFPGLGEPVEMCVSAGSAIFYHAYLVHDRSENLRDQPRKVLFSLFKAYESEDERRQVRETAAKSLHPAFVEAMDARVRQLCGLA